jgi:hypothetical protein
MKLIKVQPDNFVVVDNSEVKIGDSYYSSKGVVARMTEEMLGYYKFRNLPDTINKITHSTKELDGVKTLSLSEVKETIGEVDVEKLAAEYVENYCNDNNLESSVLTDAVKTILRIGFIDSYNRCLKDNKDKIYTESTIRSVVVASRAYGQSYTNKDVVEIMLKHIRPRTQWDVQFVDGELRLI